VHDVLILEAANDVRNGIALPYVPEELVPQPLPCASAPHKPRNINEVDRRRDDTFAADHPGYGNQAFVRYNGDAEVRVDSRERVILGLGPCPRKAIEYRGLADVRQPDYTHFHGESVSNCSKFT
jgi:hypothetical protein